jgi:endonuclease YncB( thermonuclease family)
MGAFADDSEPGRLDTASDRAGDLGSAVTETDRQRDGADKQRDAVRRDRDGHHGKRDGHRDEEPQTTTRPKPKPKARTYLVTRVIDGDTLELGNGETVRVVGIDTPEVGECGYDRATRHLADLVLGERVRLGTSDEHRDGYGRLLRYVDVGSVDAGLRLIRNGDAVARYDSRDGYGFHPRETSYIRADRASKPASCPKPSPAASPRPLLGGGGGGGENCAPGYRPCVPPAPPDLDCADVNGPIHVTGSDPHRLDADGDGIACEWG